jgi:hypothetical protein
MAFIFDIVCLVFCKHSVSETWCVSGVRHKTGKVPAQLGSSEETRLKH